MGRPPGPGKQCRPVLPLWSTTTRGGRFGRPRTWMNYSQRRSAAFKPPTRPPSPAPNHFRTFPNLLPAIPQTAPGRFSQVHLEHRYPPNNGRHYCARMTFQRPRSRTKTPFFEPCQLEGYNLSRGYLERPFCRFTWVQDRPISAAARGTHFGAF